MEVNLKAYIEAGYTVDLTIAPSEPPEPGAWILSTGQWNDAGEWDDSENWKDS